MPHRSELSQDTRHLRHLCPKKDNSDVFPGGFASCLGITLIDVAYFGYSWLSWLMDVGRYEGVAPSMWAFVA